MNDLQRQTRPRRVCRALFTVALFFDLVECALDLASGKHVTAVIMAFAATLVAATIVIETVAIRTVKRTQELNRHADRLELAAHAVHERAVTGMTAAADLKLASARLGAALGPCSHPDAEPVDLSTGERVAWVCPDPECNADLPADWTPPAKGSGTPTTFAGKFSQVTALGGAGSVSAKVTHAPRYALARSDREIAAARAAIHFEALAKVGLESCVSPCSICEQRWLDEGRFE